MRSPLSIYDSCCHHVVSCTVVRLLTFHISIIKNSLSDKEQIDFQFSVDTFLWVKKYCHHYTSHHNIKYEKKVKDNYQTSEIRNKQ